MKEKILFLLTFLCFQLFAQSKRVDLQESINPTSTVKYVVIDVNGVVKLVSATTAQKYALPKVASTIDVLGSSNNNDYIGTFVKESNSQSITAYVDSSGNKHSIASSIINQYFDGEKNWVRLEFKVIHHDRIPTVPTDDGNGGSYLAVGHDTLENFILPDTSTNYEFVNIKSDSAELCFINFILPTNLTKPVIYTFHATNRDSLIDNGVFLNYQPANAPIINFINNDLNNKKSHYIYNYNSNINDLPYQMGGGYQMSVRYVPITSTTGTWYFGNPLQVDR